MNFDRLLVKLPVAFVILLLSIFGDARFATAKSEPKRPDLTGCGGNNLAAYIGKPVDDLRSQNLSEARFVCEKNCAMTMDVRPSRLTVIYSDKTHLIVRMSCG